MATSQKALIQIELARTLEDFGSPMTDSGDHQIFTVTDGIWSGRNGYEPDIRPNGVVSGYNILSTNASNDTVSYKAFTAYSAATLYEVSASSIALTRPTVSDYKICSVIMDDTGTVDEVEGTEGTSFSTTRGASGGPPLIPVDAVEIGQVKFSSQVAAVITSDEIVQNVGTSFETYDYPMFEYSNIGKGIHASSSVEENAHVKFNEVLPLSHTGGVPKRVYIKYYVPVLTSLSRTIDFKPAELGISKTSTSVYEGSGASGVIGSMKADTVGDASFTVVANDGITDSIVREQGEVITVKFFSDANKSPYVLSQGMVGIDRTYPDKDQNTVAVTVYCSESSVEFSS